MDGPFFQTWELGPSLSSQILYGTQVVGVEGPRVFARYGLWKCLDEVICNEMFASSKRLWCKFRKPSDDGYIEL